jgi:hypothetical protein
VEHFGKRFYSTYFQCDCIVTYYNNDEDWYFVAAVYPLKVVKANADFKKVKFMS